MLMESGRALWPFLCVSGRSPADGGRVADRSPPRGVGGRFLAYLDLRVTISFMFIYLFFRVQADFLPALSSMV